MGHLYPPIPHPLILDPAQNYTSPYIATKITHLQNCPLLGKQVLTNHVLEHYLRNTERSIRPKLDERVQDY